MGLYMCEPGGHVLYLCKPVSLLHVLSLDACMCVSRCVYVCLWLYLYFCVFMVLSVCLCCVLALCVLCVSAHVCICLRVFDISIYRG